MVDYERYSHPLYITIGILLPITTLSVALRFYARHKTGVYIGIDDWLAVVSWAFWVVFCALVIYMGKNGNGYEATLLPYPVLVRFLKGFYVVPILCALLMTAAKFSILMLYLRLFSRDRGFKISVWIVGIICFAWFIAATLATSLKCIPIRAAWDPLVTGKCINYSSFAVAIEVPNSVLDFVIGGIAIRVIRGLSLNLYQKLGICFIFLLGTFVGIIGFVRCAITYHPQDYSVIEQSFWITIQNAFAVICCCLPTYRPLLPKMKNPLTMFTGNRRTEASHANSATSKLKPTAKQNSYRNLEGESNDRLDNKDDGYGWEAGTRVGTRSITDEEDYPMGTIRVKSSVDVESKSRGS